jgi:hypothetical protein
MYHQNHVINDIVLTIINDGDGSQCGFSYKDRCENPDPYTMLRAVQTYLSLSPDYQGQNMPRLKQQSEAAQILLDYYTDHVAEIQRFKG